MFIPETVINMMERRIRTTSSDLKTASAQNQDILDTFFEKRKTSKCVVNAYKELIEIANFNPDKVCNTCNIALNQFTEVRKYYQEKQSNAGELFNEMQTAIHKLENPPKKTKEKEKNDTGQICNPDRKKDTS